HSYQFRRRASACRSGAQALRRARTCFPRIFGDDCTHVSNAEARLGPRCRVHKGRREQPTSCGEARGMSAAPSSTFEAHRAHLLAIAYRMLGEMADAEDVVQEAWLRWRRADETEIRDPRGWLSAVTVRLALDALRRARARRETYVGPWL